MGTDLFKFIPLTLDYLWLLRLNKTNSSIFNIKSNPIKSLHSFRPGSTEHYPLISTWPLFSLNLFTTWETTTRFVSFSGVLDKVHTAEYSICHTRQELLYQWWRVPVFIRLYHLGPVMDYWSRCRLLNVVIELAKSMLKHNENEDA